MDHDGLYPVFISGGDWTDSYVVYEEWLPTVDLDVSMIENGQRRAGWQPAPQGMGDTLVMEAYMPAYPSNPFLRRKTEAPPLTITHHPHHKYGQPYERIVGGITGYKMSEVFGPVMLYEGQGLAGDYYVHHIYNEPPYDVWGDIYKTPEKGRRKASGNEVLQGNFSYYPIAKDGAAWPQRHLDPLFVVEQEMAVGYILAGYGKLTTKGQDVYNRNGEYENHCRTETRESAMSELPLFPDAVPFQLAGKDPTPDANDGGADGIRDGVIIVLDSGVDRKASSQSTITPDSEPSS